MRRILLNVRGGSRDRRCPRQSIPVCYLSEMSSPVLLRLVLVGIFSLVSGSAANADPCSEVDLNRTAPLKSMPILDQDGTGTCYAFAAAGMLEWELRKRGIDYSPSAIDIALVQNTKGQSLWNNAGVDGDHITPTMEAACKFGVSSRDCVEKEIRKFTSDTSQTSAQFTHILSVMNDNLSMFKTKGKEWSSTRQELATDYSVSGCNADRTLVKIDKSGLWGASVTTALAKVLHGCAGHRRKFAGLEWDTLSYGSDQVTRNHLDDLLNKKKPAGVAICAEVFDDKQVTSRLRGFSPPMPRGSNGNLKSCGSHQVMVVGRKPSSRGRCQYLVRNSWGAMWTNSNLVCACRTKNGEYHADCGKLERRIEKKATRRDIENFNSRTYVGCWVDSASLLANTLEVAGAK